MVPVAEASAEQQAEAAGLAAGLFVYVEVISRAWQKLATDVLEIGRCLLQAKVELSHGEFTRMVRGELPFGPRTAQRLMFIANNPTLSNPTHASLLPTSWTTLYELARLPEHVLIKALEDGTIRTDLPRHAVSQLKWEAELARRGPYLDVDMASVMALTSRSAAPMPPPPTHEQRGAELARQVLESLYELKAEERAPTLRALLAVLNPIAAADAPVDEHGPLGVAMVASCGAGVTSLP